ncbi:hypothetical protein NKOR_06980 [Candidatus Nitrosopumilus koreensis AR1]|uniref:Uncharacterized protein n=1 Tax=Candidatus Nitrosopumilus koreensis AR1 TaxID=1229908 RepID=K0B829_9ARCH|nr:hypothetical protein NKOR_06980 [Candidatus Nitrosopumilus koreensis AR1]
MKKIPSIKKDIPIPRIVKPIIDACLREIRIFQNGLKKRNNVKIINIQKTTKGIMLVHKNSRKSYIVCSKTSKLVIERKILHHVKRL